MRLKFLGSFPRPEWKFRVTRVNGPYKCRESRSYSLNFSLVITTKFIAKNT